MLKNLISAMLVGVLCAGTATAQNHIIVQSTTSTLNSGLLDAILPKFQAATGTQVRVVAVGTGQAIRNAQNGDGDVLLVHAKAAEERFVAQGWGVERFDVMYNDFVIIGPMDDPAGVAGITNIVTALQTIADSGVIFASRGDDSGTHRAELRLWGATEVDVAAASGEWYRETGSGMGATLNVAMGMNAYVLSDRASWIAYNNKGHAKVLVEGDARLFNQYGVILVNPAKHSNVNGADGQVFVDWLRGKEGQAAIADYQVDGQQLFFPNAK